jgi:hypothetical protein
MDGKGLSASRSVERAPFEQTDRLDRAAARRGQARWRDLADACAGLAFGGPGTAPDLSSIT